MVQVSIYGKDPTLLSVRALVLAKVGLESRCVFVDSPELIEPPHTRLVILCSSLSPAEQEQIATRVKEESAKTEILMIRSDVDGLTQHRSGVHICGNDPEEVLASSQELLNQAH